MKKIATITLMALLFAGICANAQIGITRDGTPRLLNWKYSYHSDYEYFWGIHKFDYPIPKYLPKTQKVTVYVTGTKYDHFNEEWEGGNNYREYNIFTMTFDSLGHISYIIKIYNDTLFFTYNGNRISRIFDNKEQYGRDYKLFYDNNGYLSKLKNKYGGEYHFTWTQKGTISQITPFVDGQKKTAIFTPSQVMNNGRKYIIQGDDSRLTIERDAKGGLIHYVDYWIKEGYIRYEYYYDNRYDEHGNLIEQLRYTKKDLGKYYENGHHFRYEYEFYE